MSKNTANLNLYKKEPLLDKEDKFDIKTMLNDNWDKIDQHAEQTDQKIQDIYTVKAEQNEVTNLDNRVKTLEDDVTKENYIPHTQTESIKSLPEGSLEGSVKDLKFDGMTLVNEVENGDFSDGTAGWGSTYGTISVSSNIATLTANGSKRYQKIDCFVGSSSDIYFVYSKVKVTNSECVNLAMYGLSLSNAVQINYPNSGEIYEVYVKTDASYPGIQIRHEYPDDTTANGKVMQIDGNAGVFAINMTALGIEDYTEEQMLDLVRSGYFDEMKSVENPEIEVIRKNIFDGIVDFSNGYYTLDNWTNDPAWDVCELSIKGGKTYSKSGFFGGNYTFWREGTFLSGGTGNKMVAPTNATHLRVAIRKVDVTKENQVEEAETATTYEPYKSHPIKIKETFRRVPNGTKDSCYMQNNEVWKDKRIEGHILKESDITLYRTDKINVDLVIVNYPSDALKGTLSIDGILLVSGFSGEADSNTLDLIESEYKIYTDPSAIVLIVPKGTYANLAEAQADLTGTVIQYELAIPQQINLTDLGLVEGELLSGENGTCYLDGDSLFPQNVSFEVPANTGATIGSLVESSDYQAKQISAKANKVQEDWIEPTLLNGWENYGSPLATLAFYKDEFSNVHIKGTVKSGTINQILFTLPEGYRPLNNLGFSCVSSGSISVVSILPTGSARITNGSNTDVSLDSISFRVEG